MGGLLSSGPWPLAFDATHGMLGGAAHDAGIAVSKFDRQRGLGDAHSHGLMLMDATCQDTPTWTATSVTEAPANTIRTASNRCSTTDNATSANLASRADSAATVNQVLTHHRQAPTGTTQTAPTCLVRSFFTGIKRLPVFPEHPTSGFRAHR